MPNPELAPLIIRPEDIEIAINTIRQAMKHDDIFVRIQGVQALTQLGQYELMLRDAAEDEEDVDEIPPRRPAPSANFGADDMKQLDAELDANLR
jgi:hypothetical protein